MKMILVSFIMGILFVSQAYSQTLSTKIHNQYVSLRALGMGNAFTAVADDYSLIFYNPAGFARKKNNEIQLSFVGAGIAPKTLDFAKEISDAEKSGTDDQSKADAISKVLEKYYGETMGGRVQAVEMFWIRKNWGIGLVPADISVDMTIDKQLGPSVDLNVIKDSTLAIGFGGDFNKRLSWGITAKALHRLEIEERLIAVDLATNSDIVSKDRAKEGVAFDFDVGFLYNPPWFTKIKKRRALASEQTEIVVSRKVKVNRNIAQEQPATVSTNTSQENENNNVQKVEDNVELTTTLSELVSPTAEAAANKNISESVVNTVSAPVSVSSAVAAENMPAENKEQEKEVIVEEKKMYPEYVVDEKYPFTLALVVRNAIESSFTLQKIVNDKAMYAPKKLVRVMDVGSQYEFVQWGDLTLRTMVDFKNIFHPEINFNKSLHAGFEFDYTPSGWFKTQFRAGMNQNYFTGGATLLLGIFNIEAATYGEEVGTAAQKIENRVYAAKFGMNF